MEPYGHVGVHRIMHVHARMMCVGATVNKGGECELCEYNSDMQLTNFTSGAGPRLWRNQRPEHLKQLMLGLRALKNTHDWGLGGFRT